MNRKGFTMVELIAMMTVLAILMAIAVPNISGILKSNKESIQVEDINKMIETAKRKLNNNEAAYPPKEEAGDIKKYCTVITLNALNDNGDFTKGVNDGEYQGDKSYIVIKRIDNSNGTYTYEYYIKLVEKKNNKYFSMGPVDFETFSSNPKQYSSIRVNEENVKSLTGTQEEVVAEINSAYNLANDPDKEICGAIYSFLG